MKHAVYQLDKVNSVQCFSFCIAPNCGCLHLFQVYKGRLQSCFPAKMQINTSIALRPNIMSLVKTHPLTAKSPDLTWIYVV